MTVSNNIPFTARSLSDICTFILGNFNYGVLAIGLHYMGMGKHIILHPLLDILWNGRW